MTATIKADSHTWDTIEEASAVYLAIDRNITMKSLTRVFNRVVIVLASADGSEHQHLFNENCQVVIHHNRITLTEINGGLIILDCFNETPCDLIDR